MYLYKNYIKHVYMSIFLVYLHINSVTHLNVILWCTCDSGAPQNAYFCGVITVTHW
jgi:hypothetical protein